MEQNKLYISGPLSGLPDLNYPAFADATARMRELGYDVISPAELNPQDTPCHIALRNDLRALLDCNHVLMLPGWQKSYGANIELKVAQALGMTILFQEGV